MDAYFGEYFFVAASSNSGQNEKTFNKIDMKLQVDHCLRNNYSEYFKQ